MKTMVMMVTVVVMMVSAHCGGGHRCSFRGIRHWCEVGGIRQGSESNSDGQNDRDS